MAAEPSRLVEEAQTIPLFGGRRAVWVKAGSRNIAPAVESLLALPAIECRVVIEAGDLRRNAPLRSLCERAKNAAALPCYADNERDRERLIDDEMRDAGLKLAPDARAMLIPLLGGDRQASRSEIAKLALYARGRDQVGVDDVAAVVSDASALALDDIVDATFAGRPAELETQLAKARIAGTSAGSILFAVQRQVAQLHKWRTAIEAGARILARCRAAAGQFSPQGRDRGGAQAVERGAASRRHERACRTRCCNRGATPIWPTPSPSARCWRSPPMSGAARRSSRRSSLLRPRRVPRVVDQSASLLRPTTDILAAAVTNTSLRTSSKFSRAARSRRHGGAQRVGIERLRPQVVAQFLPRQAQIGLRARHLCGIGAQLGPHHLGVGRRQRRGDHIERLATSRLICATLDSGTAPAPL